MHWGSSALRAHCADSLEGLLLLQHGFLSLLIGGHLSLFKVNPCLLLLLLLVNFNFLFVLVVIEDPGWHDKIVSFLLALLRLLLFSEGLAGVHVHDGGHVEDAIPLVDFSLENFVGEGDKVWHFDLEVGPDNPRPVRILLDHLVPIIVPVDVIVALADEGLGLVLGIDDHLLYLDTLQKLDLLRAANAAAQREHATLRKVTVGGRVRDAKRAVNAVAVADLLIDMVAVVGVVAGLAEVGCTEAAVDGDAAAVLALPVDLREAVLLTLGGASANLAQEAALAEQVLGFGVLVSLCVGHILLAVDEPTEVRLSALEALVEGASVHRELLRLAEVSISWRGESLIIQETLFLSVVQSLKLDSFFEVEQRAQFLSDGL